MENLKIYFFILSVNIFNRGIMSSYISPDNKRMFVDISAGRGLYQDFDKLTNLNETNFKNLVYNNTKNNAWIIEFYNSWCGHCHRFAPVWKQLAIDIYNWRDILSVGAVDCSNPVNTPLCREYEIMYYPMVKYFPPLPAKDFLGIKLKGNNVQQVLNNVFNILRNDTQEGIIKSPVLLPYNGKSEKFVWEKLSNEVRLVILVVQKHETIVGETLALDMLRIKEVKILFSFHNNTDLIKRVNPSSYPSLYLIDRENRMDQIDIGDSVERLIIYDKVRLKLKEKGLELPELKLEKVPADSAFDIDQIMSLMELEEEIKKKLNHNTMSDLVFQLDIENALKDSLTVEIPRNKKISGEALDALKRYVEVLVNYFPIAKKGKDYLKSIMSQIDSKSEVAGSEFGDIEARANNLYVPYLSPQSGWLGCRGSEPKFRGYPCGVWMLFHTLTVHAEQAKATDSKQVIRAMIGYIKHFFGCTDCANHFLKMAETFEGNVTTNEDSVLWLWRAHNNANKRLKTDESEDPKHPKVIFPPQKLCSSCYKQDGSWNEHAVLIFLRSMYTNISYFLVPDTTSTTAAQTVVSNILRHDNIIEDTGYNYSLSETKPLRFSFNVFDVSICVLLYAVSMVILLVICLKFLYKKSSRKKNYVLHDGFQKV